METLTYEDVLNVYNGDVAKADFVWQSVESRRRGNMNDQDAQTLLAFSVESLGIAVADRKSEIENLASVVSKMTDVISTLVLRFKELEYEVQALRSARS